ncbi:MAG: hypothetical protein KAR38_03880 [Calditrichia bacterium]|nr:hypothetical protein [Calditrichia bacterium]
MPGKLIIIAVLVIAIILGGCKKENGEMQKFHEFVQQFEENNRAIREKSDRLNLLFKDVMEVYPDSLKVLIAGLDTSLTEKEINILERMIKNEQDTSLKSQLQQILQLEKEIDEANREIDKLRQVLPMPVVVKRGQSHYKLCMDYLMENHSLTKDESRKLIEKTGLFEPLVENFYVWHYYHNEIFGSFVTQGEALISPMAVYRRSKEQAKIQLETARSKRDSAIFISAQLKKMKESLENELGETQESLFKTKGKMDSLRALQKRLETELNSIRYYIDTEKSLKNAEYLHAGFLRKTKIRNLPPNEMFMTLDLRKGNTISMEASQYGFDSFKKVLVFPKSFKMGVDYKLSYNLSKTIVSIIIKKPHKFRQNRIIIAVE